MNNHDHHYHQPCFNSSPFDFCVRSGPVGERVGGPALGVSLPLGDGWGAASLGFFGMDMSPEPVEINRAMFGILNPVIGAIPQQKLRLGSTAGLQGQVL